VVCGTGGNRDWSEHPAHADAMQVQFLSTYNGAGGHRHVHGVNLGVSTQAHHAVGGEYFAPVEALQEAGTSIAWSAAPRVCTSAGSAALASHGLSAAICLAVNALAAATTAPVAKGGCRH
jgi:hypothetical protein